MYMQFYKATTVNLGYLPADCHTFNALVNTTGDRLLSSILRNSYHILRSLFPLSSPDGMASASEPIHFTIPLKAMYSLCPVSSPRFDFSSRCFSIPHVLSATIISISLSLHLVVLAPIN